MSIDPTKRVAHIDESNNIKIYNRMPTRWAFTTPYHKASYRWHADGWRELISAPEPSVGYENYGDPIYTIDGDVVRETYNTRTIEEGNAEWEASDEYLYRASLALNLQRLVQIITAANITVQNEGQVFAEMAAWARADGLEALQDTVEAQTIWITLRRELGYDANLILYGTKTLSLARGTSMVVDV